MEHVHPTKKLSKATYRVVEETFIPVYRVIENDGKSQAVNITKYFERVAAASGTYCLSASCCKVIQMSQLKETLFNVYVVINKLHATQ